MRFVRGIRFPVLFSILASSVAGCSRLEEAFSGEFTLQVGSWTWKIPARGAASDRPNAIYSGAPAPTFPKRQPVVQRREPSDRAWGSCDSEASHDPIASAKAELIGLKLVSPNGDRVETIPISRSSFDLLRFSSQLSEILSQHALPAGEYSEIRVLVRNAVLVDSKGHKLALNIPKGDTEGVAIRLNRLLTIDAASPMAKVTLTFCTGNNFLVEQARDKSTRNAFHPVIDRVINLSI